ncbi:MAG TPA: FAD-binding oxidoreductase [Pseudolysinimonas sp.]|nr:FAD-binding oxidoreductase [Pseudolysinimonas sp.]
MINGKVSHWWEQAGTPPQRDGLPGDVEADVAIVGAGYTGLWTAYSLARLQPDLRIVVVEERHAGFGASGRNGGWMSSSITGGRSQYIRSHGRDTVERFQALMNGAIDEIIEVTKRERIDADIVKSGALRVARSPAQLGRMRASAREAATWKSTDLEILDGPAVRERIDIPDAVGGTWSPHFARVSPVKLALGLATACERAGVTIYEGTRVTAIEPGRLRTAHGTVSAEFVVRATEGFTARMPRLHRRWLPMNSSMIVTEPLSPATWESIGWQQRELLGDFAHVYFYAQRTADDRIAIGGRGVPYRYGSRVDSDGTTQAATAATLRRMLHRLLPAAGDAEIAHLWSGVLGVPRDWAASVGLDRRTGMAWAGGYVGTGVTAANLAGRTLADLILDRDSELVTMPWVGHLARNWEPEPLRWFATTALYAAYGIADRTESSGRATTSPIARIADVVTGRH